jgi:hypothetical protein
MNRYNIIRCQIILLASPFDIWLALLISLRSEIESSVATIYLSICLICGSRALVNLGHFLSFLIYTQSVGFLGRGISPS